MLISCFNLIIFFLTFLVLTNLLIIDLFIKNLRAFKRDIQSKNNKSIIKKLVNTKKVRKKIIKLKQDINKPDFGRS